MQSNNILKKLTLNPQDHLIVETNGWQSNCMLNVLSHVTLLITI